MKKYFKKTTTNSKSNPKIREALYNFTTKYLGKDLKHLRKLRTDTVITDATLISFATGKVNALQETKVFVVSKHNGVAATDSTTTYAIPLNKTTLYLKTMRYNPHMRTTKYKNELNNTVRRNYATPTKQQATTWTEWCTTTINHLSPYFTSEYYYIGQVAAGVAVTCYYAIPYVIKKLYPYKATESVASSTLPTQNTSEPTTAAESAASSILSTQTPSEPTLVKQAAESVASSTLSTQNQPTTAAESAASSILSTQTPSEPTLVKQAVEIANSLSSKQEEELNMQAYSYIESAFQNRNFLDEKSKILLEKKCNIMIENMMKLTKLVVEHREIFNKDPVAVDAIQNMYKLAHRNVLKAKVEGKIDIDNIDTLFEILLLMSTYFN